MDFERIYKQLLSQISNSELTDKILEREYLIVAENWFRGLAILEFSLRNLNSESRDFVVQLYEKLFLEDLDFNASHELDDLDYDFYFKRTISILHEIATFHPHAYSQIAFQYQEARRGYKDNDKIKEFLFLALDNGVSFATGVIGYYYTLGWNFIKDEDLGRSFLQDDENPWVLQYKGYIDLSKGVLDDIPKYYRQMNFSDDPKILRNAKVLEALYLQKKGRNKESNDLFKGLIEQYHLPYAYFQSGLYFMFRAEDIDFEKGMMLLGKAAQLGNVEAMTNYAYYSYPDKVQQTEDLNTTLKWFYLAHLYGNSYASYRLGLIYIYEPLFRDVSKGLEFINIAAEDSLPEAIAELAELNLAGDIIEKNIENAYDLHLKAANELGYGFSYYRLGMMEEYGLNKSNETDFNAAFSFYQKAADLDSLRGIGSLAKCYRYGIGVEADNNKAKEYFEKGLEMNDPYCTTELGLLYEDKNVGEDLSKAFDLFCKAADMNGGYPYASYLKGVYLLNGYHTGEPDEEGAFLAFQQAAEMGYVSAIYEIGRCYKFGWGVDRDPDKALEYLRKAADEEYVPAFVEIALCYEYEIGVSFDANETYNWMMKAAEQEYSFAQFKVGYYLMHGSLGETISLDLDLGFKWMVKAMENGSPQACLELGDYYLYDFADIDESDKAYEYYLKAYESDYINEGLGLCFLYGIGVERSDLQAFNFFEIAANRGNVVAMYRLGVCLSSGEGTKKNKEEAFNWFYNAANEGNYLSLYEAGCMLIKGIGVEVNKEEGLHFLQKAADNNVAKAQFELGNCYLMGDAVEENEEQALYWYKCAAENGDEQAMKLVGNLL